MADFCMQCHHAHGFPEVRTYDLAGLTTPEDWAKGLAALAICEGCGPTQVDPDGRCMARGCFVHHECHACFQQLSPCAFHTVPERVPVPDFYRIIQDFNNEVVGPDVDRTRYGLNKPGVPAVQLGVDLVTEEVVELLEALGFHGAYFNWMVYVHDDIDWEKAVDAGCDILYVVVGMLLRIGIPADVFYAAFNEVTRANMDKKDGPMREDGKRLKPVGWRPPDIAGVLEAYIVDPPDEMVV